MVRWNSSPHPISDIRDWVVSERLEVRPGFQRRKVWSAPAQIMLMDTILRNIPMPKIFLSNTIKDGNTYRVVIDGQQRITAILDFLRDMYKLETPYKGSELGKKFSELDMDSQNRFLSYQIDFNEATNLTEDDAREVYSRINKYTVPLNKQELRRADFPGNFLRMSETLAINEYFDKIKLFSPANRRRYSDVEYISELLAGMIGGIQDKKTTLDNFYIKYSIWDNVNKENINNRFLKILEELNLIFDSLLDINETRFRQRSDFYTIFLAIDEFVSEGHTVKGKEISFLQEDLKILNFHIKPESEIEICSEYAIKCVSQANSASSRRWRRQFIKVILHGTFVGGLKNNDDVRIFYKLSDELSLGDMSGYCPDPVFRCPVCDDEISGNFSNCVLAWRRSDLVNQIENSYWMHKFCIKDKDKWLVLERPNNE